jgi:hypothetical protein
VPEEKSEEYTVCRYVPEQKVKTVSYQVCRNEIETIEKTVPYRVCRLVPEEREVERHYVTLKPEQVEKTVLGYKLEPRQVSYVVPQKVPSVTIYQVPVPVQRRGLWRFGM